MVTDRPNNYRNPAAHAPRVNNGAYIHITLIIAHPKFSKGVGNLNFLAEIDLKVDSKTSQFRAHSIYNMRETNS